MESPIFGKLYSPRSPQKPKIRQIGTRWQVLPIDASPLMTARSPSVEGTGVYRQYLPSACVDIRPSPRRQTYLFVCNFCVFVWLWISPPRIKLEASNFARRFILGRESPILGNVAPHKPKIACRPRLTDVKATFYL